MRDTDPWGQGTNRLPRGWTQTGPNEWVFRDKTFNPDVPPRAASSEARRKAQAKRAKARKKSR